VIVVGCVVLGIGEQIHSAEYVSNKKSCTERKPPLKTLIIVTVVLNKRQKQLNLYFHKIRC